MNKQSENKMWKLLGTQQINNIFNLLIILVNCVMIYLTFLSVKTSLNIAYGKTNNYIINYGFSFASDKKGDYDYFSVIITNSSKDTPINLTGDYSLSYSTNMNFYNNSKEFSKRHIENFNYDLGKRIFPINIAYGESKEIIIDENFAELFQMYLSNYRPYHENFFKTMCIADYELVNVCLYDTLENKYCFILKEYEIEEIASYKNGKYYYNE